MHRVFNRIDPIAEGGRQYRHSLSNVDVYEHSAHFVGERELEVGGVRITGDRIVIAAGARSFIPDVPGLADVPFHTSDSILRIAQQPQHLIIFGGGFIATELGHVFQALGSKVTIINRGHHLLSAEDHDVSRRFTELADGPFDLALGSTVQMVSRTDTGVAVHVRCDGGDRVIEGDVLLVEGSSRFASAMRVVFIAMVCSIGFRVVGKKFVCRVVGNRRWRRQLVQRHGGTLGLAQQGLNRAKTLIAHRDGGRWVELWAFLAHRGTQLFIRGSWPCWR